MKWDRYITNEPSMIRSHIEATKDKTWQTTSRADMQIKNFPRLTHFVLNCLRNPCLQEKQSYQSSDLFFCQLSQSHWSASLFFRFTCNIPQIAGRIQQPNFLINIKNKHTIRWCSYVYTQHVKLCNIIGCFGLYMNMITRTTTVRSYASLPLPTSYLWIEFLQWRN